LKSLTDAKQRLEEKNIKTIIRPWLQDFSLRNRYNREQLQAQTKAVRDAGLQEWIFWNPGNNYQINKYELDPEL
jgi:mRNA-degrading endonuclease YafQ of YafQ-DinJ toxin-antitoxin module